MEPAPHHASELATFEPRLAEAVAAVLRRAGVPAGVAPGPEGEMAVLVPADRRDRALATLARHMDEVHAHAAGPAAQPAPEPDRPAADRDDPAPRPLMLERFRRFGFVAVLLVPLLVLSLSDVRLPATAVVAGTVAVVVLLTAWRTGRMGRRR